MQSYQAEIATGLSHGPVSRWYQSFREICSRRMQETEILFGQEVEATCDSIVEIDESLFGKKRKYNRGRTSTKQWVFGIIERSTGMFFVKLVEDRTKATLRPLINQHVKKGATIWSDQFSTYITLNQDGYKHGTVNHSKEFKSDDGVCTNTIEGLWSRLKWRINRMKGVSVSTHTSINS